jgi:Na+-driven multidrug efflux pump
MLLNFFLTYLFLKLFGGIGAAYATIIYYVTSLVTMIMLLKKYVNIDPKNIINIAINRYKEMWKYINRQNTKT